MRYWIKRVVQPYCNDFGYKSFCEIGASMGQATDKVLSAQATHLTVIDPCMDADLCAKYNADKRVEVRKGLSLDEIPKLTEKFDCILIDGDHNWYTVINELRAIHERQLLRPGGTIFLHDVNWPYARRDMYYQPNTVPKEFRHPHARKGIVYNRSELCAVGGVNDDLDNAEFEGGPRNGVLTAIENFLQEHGDDYLFFCFKAENGLGVIVKKQGLESASLVEKWRRRCTLQNMLVAPRNLVKHRLPNFYQTVRRAAKN